MKIPKLYFCIFLFSLFSCSTPFPSLLGLTSQHVYGFSNQSSLSSGKIEKSGESCSYSSIFVTGLFYGKGNSVEEARKKAGITKIAVIDRSSLNIVGPFFYEECTIVWGEE